MKRHIDYLLSKPLGLLVAAVSLLNFGEIDWVGYIFNQDWIINWEDFGAILAISIMLSFICVIPILLFMKDKGKILKILSIPMLSMLFFVVSRVFWCIAYIILGINFEPLYDYVWGGIELTIRLVFSVKLAVPFVALWLVQNRNIIIKTVATFLSVIFINGIFSVISDPENNIDLPSYLFELIFHYPIKSVNFTPMGIGLCLISVALFVITPLILGLRRYPRLEAESKTNVVIAVISMLLLCSLLLNSFFYYNRVAETNIVEYKKSHCPMQMESIKKLENECQDTDREINIELPEDTEWLGTPAETQQDWGTLQIDESVNYKPLITNNKFYKKGIGTHASATLVYNLGGKYERLTAVIGLDEGESCSNGVQVKVFGDEELLADSGELGYGMDFSLDVSLKGIEKLVFDIDPLGNKDCDHVNIVVPILYRLKELK